MQALNKDLNLIVKVRLIRKGAHAPLGGDYSVRLYDKDVFNDDYLGVSDVTDGLASFTLQPDQFRQPFGADEKPDFYFVVYHRGAEIFKSEVMEDVDLANFGEFVIKKGNVLDLGSFLIDTNP